MLKPGGQIEGDEALEFYAKHTAQIEVKGNTGGVGRCGLLGKSSLQGNLCKETTVTLYMIF